MPTANEYARMSPEKRAENLAKKRAWRAANKDKVRAQDKRAWAKLRADPERVAKYNRRQTSTLNAKYASDPEWRERHLERQAEWRKTERGRETMNSYLKEYRETHPEFYCEQAAKSALAAALGCSRAEVPQPLIEAKGAEYLVRKAIREARRAL